VRRLTESIGGGTSSRVGNDQRLAVPADVLFDFDRATLTPAAKGIIGQLAVTLNTRAKGQSVRVIGHTDDQGSDSYNLGLSRRRAQAVAAVLRPAVAAAGITVQVSGKGETEPLLPNRDDRGEAIPANQALNRRVTAEFESDAAVSAPTVTARPAPAAARARPATGAAPAGSLASAGLTVRGGAMRADVLRATRLPGDQVGVRVLFTAVDGDALTWGGTEPVLGPNPYPRSANETMLGVSVVDPGSRTRYHPLDEGDGYCLCTRDIGSGYLYRSAPFELWAYFPAPAVGVDRVDLQLGRFGLLGGVPLAAADASLTPTGSPTTSSPTATS
jgi:outer membrane protein OmpA-like peptidoglycan-associated protein